MSQTLKPLTSRAVPGDAAGGHIELPGGLIIQWGSVPNVPANGSVSVSYKKPFPNGALSLAIGSGSTTPGKPAITYHMVSASGAQFHNTSATIESGISTYIVIGY